MTPLSLVYHPDYSPAGHPHFERLRAIADHAVLQGLGIVRQPECARWSDLEGLHEPEYLAAYRMGIEPLASSSGVRWSQSTSRSSLLMLGGQELAASIAAQEGICFNLACGFHHAHPERGGGNCALNGLAYLAHRFPAKRVVVLDCDEHGGDGTEAFCAKLPNLHQVTLFGSRYGTRSGIRSMAIRVPAAGLRDSDQLYLDALDGCLDHVLGLEPDLLVYQAGMDVHRLDPKSSLKLDTETVARRDWAVFHAVARAGLPTVAVLAGAYQTIDGIVGLYATTFRLAHRALNERPSSPIHTNETPAEHGNNLSLQRNPGTDRRRAQGDRQRIR